MIVTARAPVIVGDKLYFYYGGCDGLHDDKRVNAAIGLATLRLDGFCSMRAGDTEGWLISRRDPFRRPVVTINARTGTDGLCRGRNPRPAQPGGARLLKEDCVAFRGDSVRHELKWKSAEFTAAQKANDYKIRFWLKNADLFSYLPADLDPSQPDIARIPAAKP